MEQEKNTRSKSNAEGPSELLELLNYLLIDDKDTPEEKLKRLNTDFGIEPTPTLKKGLEDMNAARKQDRTCLAES